MNLDSREYFVAASNKVEAAREVFLPELREAVSEANSTDLRELESPAHTPPVRVRAFFESLLWSATAAREQFTEALAIELRAKSEGREVVAALRDHNPEMAQELEDWWGRAIVREAHELRRLATHHYYNKRGGPTDWEVDPPSSGTLYDGSRKLVDYAEALITALTDLERMMSRFWATGCSSDPNDPAFL